MKKLLFLLLIITSLTSCMPAVVITSPQVYRPMHRHYFYQPMPVYRPYVYRPYNGPYTYHHNGPVPHYHHR